MIDAILISLLTPMPVPVPVPTPAVTPVVGRATDDVKDAIRAAGKNVDELIALAERWTAEQNEGAARTAFERVLKLDDKNAAAHHGLSHHEYDGEWYETYAALSAHRRAEAKRMLDEHGLVRYGDEWAPVTDVPFMRMGWAKAEEGGWLRPDEKAELDRGKELAAEGWEQQDLVWVAPADFDKWRSGKWKVGEEWMSKNDANTAHSELNNPWRVAAKHFVAITTCDRDTAGWVGWHADLVYPDLARLFGKVPARKLEVVALKDIAQYNAFAAGSVADQRSQTDASGYSSVHYAYFGESWFDTAHNPPVYRGAGVCYWDRKDATLDPYGLHAVRHAAAQSYIDAIDPSWDTVSRLIERNNPNGFNATDFWGEKLVPQWLRYGAASYCERYFQDPNAADGTSPWWAREWALENLRKAGGMRDLEDVWAFALDPADPTRSGQLISEAGCIVSFILDGQCAPVAEKHQAFKAALESGEGVAEAAEALQKALEKNRKKLEKYAGL
ncbi:MAG: hypothetical protein GY711_14140 [bacterium]|nr:hypothetical protein [bacterium]